MPVGQLLAPTPILSEGSLSASATLPTIPDGADRVVLVSVHCYNGGSTASPPPSINSNGRTGLWIAGDAPGTPQTRITTGWYMFLEVDIPFITGQPLVSSSGTGTQKSIDVQVLHTCQQAVPVNVNSGRASTGTITLPLTRAANSFTVAKGFTSSAATALTFTGPSRTGTIDFATRDASYAILADSAGTSNFTCVASGYTSVVIANFLTVESYKLDNINGGTNSVQIGSIDNIANTTNLTTVSSATLNGVVMTPITGSVSPWTFTCPPLTDGAVSPYPGGLFTITGTEGSPTLSNVVVTLPTGLVEQVLAGTLNTTNNGVLFNFNPAAVVGDRIFYPSVPAVNKYITIDPKGNIDTNFFGDVVFWHYEASTRITRSFIVLLGNTLTIDLSACYVQSESPKIDGSYFYIDRP